MSALRRQMRFKVEESRRRVDMGQSMVPMVPVMAGDLEALLDDIERLSALVERDHLLTRAILERRGDATVASVEACGSAMVWLAAECRWVLRDAPNYMELKFQDDLGELLVTVQRAEGETPAAKVARLEAELARLKETET